MNFFTNRHEGNTVFLTSKATQSFVLGQIHKMAAALELSLNTKETFQNFSAKAGVFLLEAATILTLLVTTPVDFSLKTAQAALFAPLLLVGLVVDFLALGILGVNPFDKDAFKELLVSYRNFGRDIANNFRTIKELAPIASPLKFGENEYPYLFQSRVIGSDPDQEEIYGFLKNTLPEIMERFSRVEGDQPQKLSREELAAFYKKLESLGDPKLYVRKKLEFAQYFKECLPKESKEKKALNQFLSIINCLYGPCEFYGEQEKIADWQYRTLRVYNRDNQISPYLPSYQGGNLDLSNRIFFHFLEGRSISTLTTTVAFLPVDGFKFRKDYFQNVVECRKGTSQGHREMVIECLKESNAPIMTAYDQFVNGRSLKELFEDHKDRLNVLTAEELSYRLQRVH